MQLATAQARRVVAVAHNAAKRERIAVFGPDAVIDPEDPEWVTHAREALGPAGAMVILDNVGTSLGPDAFSLLAQGGRFSAHATPSGGFTQLDPDQVRERGATVTGIEQVQLSNEELAELTDRPSVRGSRHRRAAAADRADPPAAASGRRPPRH